MPTTALGVRGPLHRSKSSKQDNGAHNCEWSRLQQCTQNTLGLKAAYLLVDGCGKLIARHYAIRSWLPRQHCFPADVVFPENVAAFLLAPAGKNYFAGWVGCAGCALHVTTRPRLHPQAGNYSNTALLLQYSAGDRMLCQGCMKGAYMFQHGPSVHKSGGGLRVELFMKNGVRLQSEQSEPKAYTQFAASRGGICRSLQLIL